METREYTWAGILTELLAGSDLSADCASWVMQEVMSGNATAAQQGGFLMAMQAKDVTAGELLGFREAILAGAASCPLPRAAVDIVGTGGDKLGTVNISTTAAFVTAGAGVPVIKHGNKAVSSKSGASDVLGELGANLLLDPEGLGSVFSRVGMTFVYAGNYFPSFKNVAAARKDLGIPTVFNYLGPLCNPAKPIATALGVARAEVVPLLAEAFRQRGDTALVFRGGDGLDELTTTCASRVWEVTDGEITEHEVNPQDLGIKQAQIADLLGGTPAENAQILCETLAGEKGAVRDIVALNAAAAITAFKLAQNPELHSQSLVARLQDDLELAFSAIDSGAATAKLEAWVASTNAV